MIERTLVLLKPDAVQRGLMGEIITRFEHLGLKIVGMKMVHPSQELVEKHYPLRDSFIVGMGKKTLDAGGEEQSKKIFNTINPREIGLTLRQWLVNFLTSAPVVAVVLEGNKSIEIVRKICGFTDPAKADVGTIRGDFTHTGIEVWNAHRMAVKNLIHASGDREEAKYEINLWFKLEELHEYKTTQEAQVF